MMRLSAAEDQIQGAVVDLLRLCARSDCIWYAVPNGESRSERTGAKLKRQGVRAGVADIALVLPSGRAAFVEVKTPKGRLSPEQRAFEEWCLTWGVPYAVVRSLTEAEQLFKGWQVLRQPTTATAKAFDSAAMRARGR